MSNINNLKINNQQHPFHLVKPTSWPYFNYSCQHFQCNSLSFCLVLLSDNPNVTNNNLYYVVAGAAWFAGLTLAWYFMSNKTVEKPKGEPEVKEFFDEWPFY